MAWIYLLLAGICEIVWAVASKYSQGLTRLWPSVATIVCIPLSVVLLMLAMKRLPLETSYAIWTGIGAVGTVVWGMVFLNESRDLSRMACIALILIGIIGLRALSPA